MLMSLGYEATTIIIMYLLNYVIKVIQCNGGKQISAFSGMSPAANTATQSHRHGLLLTGTVAENKRSNTAKQLTG
jgi:hypothetical protein